MGTLKKTSTLGEMPACLSGNSIEHLKEIDQGLGLDSHLWQRNRIVCRRL